MKKKNLKIVAMSCLMAFGAVSFQSCEDDDRILISIPSEVIDEFEMRYPTVPVVEWDWDDGEIVGEFHFSGFLPELDIYLSHPVEAEAFFAPCGKWICTEFDVTDYFSYPEREVIPGEVRDIIRKYQRRGYELEEIILQESAGAPACYVVEFDDMDAPVIIDF